MDEFIARVTALKASLSLVDDCTAELKNKVRAKFTNILDPASEQRVNTEIRSIEQIFKEKVSEVKAELESIDNENKKMLEEGYEVESSFLYETRTSHFNAMTNRLGQIVNKFRRVQLDFLNREEDRALSQYMVENPGLTADDARSQMKRDEMKKGSKKAKGVLSKAELRSRNVNEIMKSVQEIAALIEELDLLVNSQQRSIQRIEEVTEKNVKVTAKAKKSLTSALDMQKRATFWKRVMITVISIVVVAIVIYLFFALGGASLFSKNNNNNN